MIGHLGTRVSALLDGQLPPAEAERLWEHVYGCHLCRDLVEGEGWVKTRLSALGASAQAPDHLKGALLGAGCVPVPSMACSSGSSRSRRAVTVAVGAGSAAGMAVMGVLALGASPADAPAGDPRIPTANLTSPADGGSSTPVRDQRP